MKFPPTHTILLSTAFLAGVLLTLGFKDFYPDLELRFRRSRRRYWPWGSLRSVPHSTTLASAGLLKGGGAEGLLTEEEEDEVDDDANQGWIGLEDHTRPHWRSGAGRRGDREKGIIKKGIEACVGNTPLIRIESLSRETGCEILAKAEVSLGNCDCFFVFSLRGFTRACFGAKPENGGYGDAKGDGWSKFTIQEVRLANRGNSS